MKRFGANKIYLSENECFVNSVIELDDDGRLIRVVRLEDSDELASTPFYNGVIAPFPPVACEDLSFSGLRVLVGDVVTCLTLLTGEKLFSDGVDASMQVIWRKKTV